MAKLVAACTPLKPLDRAETLENDRDLEASHTAVALKGQSAVPARPDDVVNFHYKCFVKSSRNRHLYELDGDENGPVDHGLLNDADDVLSDKALGVIRDLVQRHAGNLGFSLLALAPAH